jgi:hypothetical protein
MATDTVERAELAFTVGPDAGGNDKGGHTPQGKTAADAGNRAGDSSGSTI